MNQGKEVKLLSADRLADSVIMTFSDGRSGIYSSQLLHAMLSAARELHDSDNIDTEPKPGNKEQHGTITR